jgi:hypothetical protein
MPENNCLHTYSIVYNKACTTAVRYIKKLPDGRGGRKMYTERKALEDYIIWLKEERRRLGEEYWKAIERLKQMDENIAAQGTSELVERLMLLVEDQNKTVDKLSKMVPPVPASAAIELFKQETNEIINKVEIQKERDKEEKQLPVKRARRQDRKVIAQVIKHFLKNKGVPVKSKHIQKHLEGQGYKVNNITVLLQTAQEHEPTIKKAMRGYYQA